MEYFTVDFICHYDMKRYPFDTQECFGNIEPKVNSGLFVELVPSSLQYTGPTNLPTYQLISIAFADKVSFKKGIVTSLTCFKFYSGNQTTSQFQGDFGETYHEWNTDNNVTNNFDGSGKTKKLALFILNYLNATFSFL